MSSLPLCNHGNHYVTMVTSRSAGDLVRTRTHDDVILSEMPEFWLLVLKLIDDIKDSVRKSAAKTAGNPSPENSNHGNVTPLPDKIF